MQILLSMFIGSLISLVAMTEYQRPAQQLMGLNAAQIQQMIQEDMEEKFNRRDAFREKGNSGKYLTYFD